MSKNLPFTNIALAFSGGGYRAATFSLGALSLLEKVGLLPSVSAISSVSGGSITAVKYAQSLIDDESFDKFYNEYYQYLNEDTLGDNALGHLKNKKLWKQKENFHKKRNVINSYAIEYNRFTKHRTFGNFDDYAKKETSTLKRIIINSADFTASNTFRMQNLLTPSYDFGHGKLCEEYKEFWRKIKLGDALGASACFPGAFEPIRYPNDFVADQAHLKAIGLMDGGIIDNQGTSSYMTVKKKNNKHNLFFVSDVASPYVYEPYEFTKSNFITRLSSVLANPWGMLLIVTMTIGFFIKQWWTLYSIGLLISALMLGIQVGLIWASRELKKEASFRTGLKLPSSKIGYYLLDRLNSFLHMNSIIFLKSARRGHANFLYERYPDKSITSTIYELRCKEGKPEFSRVWKYVKPYIGDIPNEIKNISEKVAKFPTTLWFSDAHKQEGALDDLIACGEFTACYNLIEHIVAQNKDEIGTNSEIGQLFENLIGLWKEFAVNPKYLIHFRLGLQP